MLLSTVYLNNNGYYITDAQIHLMNEIRDNIYDKQVFTFETDSYTIKINFATTSRSSFLDIGNYAPSVEVISPKWQGPLKGSFETKYCEPEENHYLTYLSAGLDFPDVEVPDDVLISVNEEFFKVFTDDYINNLHSEKEDKETKKKEKATYDFFNSGKPFPINKEENEVRVIDLRTPKKIKKENFFSSLWNKIKRAVTEDEN